MWENKTQTAYIYGIVRQTGEKACAYNNKPGPQQEYYLQCASWLKNHGEFANEITVGIVAPPTLPF